MFWKCRCCEDDIVWTTHRMFTAESPPAQVWRADHGNTLQKCKLLSDSKLWVGGHPHFDNATIGYQWARLHDADGALLLSSNLGLTSPANQYVYSVEADTDGDGYFGGWAFPKWKQYSQAGSLIQDYTPSNAAPAFCVTLDDSLNLYCGGIKDWSSTNDKPVVLFKYSNAGTLQWTSNLNNLVAPVFGNKAILSLDTDGSYIYSIVLLDTTGVPGFPQYHIYKTAVDGTHVSNANKTSDTPLWIKIAGNGDLLVATLNGGYKRYDSTSFSQVGAAILGSGNTFGPHGGGNTCIDEDDDGNIYIVGSGTMNGLPASMIKFDSAGNVLEVGYHGGALRGISVNPSTQEFAVCGVRVLEDGTLPSWQ